MGAANPAGPDGPVVAGGPVGPCGMLSPLFHEVLGPLEHSVLDHAGPAGQHVAVGHVGRFRTLSPSDCHPAGPAGPYVAGGHVGPDGMEHSVLDHAGPAGSTDNIDAFVTSTGSSSPATTEGGNAQPPPPPTVTER